MLTEFLGVAQDPSGDDVRRVADSTYVFAYNVRFTNTGHEHVKLLGRHWIIEDASGRKEEVPKGSPGVVGYTPCLYPGTIFEYGRVTEQRAKHV